MTNNPANVHQAGGNLLLTPIVHNGKWTSGRIETKDVFQAPAGGQMRIEGRLALPDVHGTEARGYWPAFWALGEDQRKDRWSWPATGETDFTESVNGVNKNWATLHCGYKTMNPNPCGETGGVSNHGLAPASGDIWGQFHSYTFVWDKTRGTGKDQLRWYVDGKLVHSVDQTDPAVKDVWKTMDKGYFIILNVAMGGQFPAALGGGPDGSTASGKSMSVDYVKVETVHLDSKTGPVLGNPLSYGFGASAGWRDIPLDVNITGIHTVVVTLASGQPNPFVLIDTLKFVH
jgi:beta-glucanase (GH16 family)